MCYLEFWCVSPVLVCFILLILLNQIPFGGNNRAKDYITRGKEYILLIVLSRGCK